MQRRPAVIVTAGGSSTLAVRAASLTVLHVFLSQDDPVNLGLVVSFNHPGGNANGMSLLTSALVVKRLEFVRQLVPADAPIFYLINPQAPDAEFHLSYMQAAAREIGQQINILNDSSQRDIDIAFTTLAQRGGAVSTDPFFNSRFHQIVVLSTQHRIPAIYDRREFVMAGALISYEVRRRISSTRRSRFWSFLVILRFCHEGFFLGLGGNSPLEFVPNGLPISPQATMGLRT